MKKISLLFCAFTVYSLALFNSIEVRANFVPGAFNTPTAWTQNTPYSTTNMPAGFKKYTAQASTDQEFKLTMLNTDWNAGWGSGYWINAFNQTWSLPYVATGLANAFVKAFGTNQFMTVVTSTNLTAVQSTFGFLKTSASPINVSAVSGGITSVDTNTSVAITITLSASKCVEEFILIRYTIDNWVTSGFVTATGSETSYSATIPGITVDNSTVKWYALTSTLAAPTPSTDFLTLSVMNNAGSNYSYFTGTGLSIATDHFRSKATGIWNTPGSWESSAGGNINNWVTATLVPGNTATAIEILSTHIITIDNSVTVNTALSGAGTLTNSTTGTLNLTGGTSSVSTLANAGTVAISGTATSTTALANFTNTGAINISGSGTITGITNNAAGTVNHSGSSTVTSFNNATATSTLNISTTTVPTFTTLTVSAAGNTVNYTGAGAQTVKDVVYGGNLTLSGTGTKTWTLAAARTVGGILTVGSGAGLTTAGNFTLGVTGVTNITGTLTLGGTSAKTFTGDVTLNSGGVWNETGVAAINFAGNLTNNATTFTSNTGIHTFSGATKTMSGATTTSIGSVTVTGTYTNSGILTVATALGGTGTLTNSATGTLNLGGTSAVTTLTASAAGNTVNYTGAAQTVKVVAYSNLTLSGSGIKTCAVTSVTNDLTLAGTATVTHGAALTVGRDLLLNGGTFTTGAFTLAVTRNLVLNGGNLTTTGAFAATVTGTTTITTGTLNVPVSAGDKTFTGLVTLNGGTMTGASTTVVLGGGGFANAGGIVTLTGTVTMSTAATLSGANNIGFGTLTVTTVVVTNNGTLTVATALGGTGTLTNSATGTLNLGGTSAVTTLTASAAGNTVNYTGVTQDVATGTYSTLNITAAGTKTALGNITATTLDNGGASNVASVLDMVGYTLTGLTDNTGATVKFSGASNGLAIGTGTVEYYGATQDVATGTYSTLNITAAGTKTALGNITATTLDNGGASNVASVLDMVGYTLTGLTDNTGATVKFSGVTNGQVIGTGTVQYYGATAQTVAAGTYSTLQISNTTGASIGAATTAAILTIDASSILNLSAGKQLTVSTTHTNNGTLNLLSDNANGTATILTPATITGSGTANVNQFLPTTRSWYVSSPVSNGTAAMLLGNVFSYAETSNAWGSETGSLTPGKGYFAQNPSGHLTFTGTLNNGDVSIALTRSVTAKPGWNLVANPYPSHITWTEAIASAANTETTIWYRTKPDAAYAFHTFNATSSVGSPSGTTGFIPPMQAFWVRAYTGGGTLNFTNAMRSHSATANPLKAPAAPTSVNQILRLQVTGNDITDEAVVYFNSNAANGYDAYDSPKMMNGSTSIVPDIYTKIGNENAVINGMNSIPYNVEIPLYFKANASGAGTFTIKANEFSNFDADIEVKIKNNLTGEQQVISDGSDYTFDVSTAAIEPAFSLIVRAPGATTNIHIANTDKIIIFANTNRQIDIRNYEAGSMVSVYNAVGQKIYSSKAAKTTTQIDAPASGVYLVTVTSRTTAPATKKIIIK